MSYFLVTGASKGIGKAIAIELAKKGKDLLLVARSEDQLKVLSDQVKEHYKIDVYYLPLDLLKENAVKNLFDFVTRHNLSLTGCINNAGIGAWGKFTADNLENLQNVQRLNIFVLTDICYKFIHQLLPGEKCYLMNVGSTAAFQPTPYMSVYSATKTYVHSFTRALREEMRSERINITCLCPGPTNTGFSKGTDLGELDKINQRVAMSADKVAKAGVKGLFNDEATIIPGFSNRVGAQAASLFPDSVVIPLVGNVFKKMGK